MLSHTETREADRSWRCLLAGLPPLSSAETPRTLCVGCLHAQPSQFPAVVLHRILSTASFPAPIIRPNSVEEIGGRGAKRWAQPQEIGEAPGFSRVGGREAAARGARRTPFPRRVGRTVQAARPRPSGTRQSFYPASFWQPEGAPGSRCRTRRAQAFRRLRARRTRLAPGAGTAPRDTAAGGRGRRQGPGPRGGGVRAQTPEEGRGFGEKQGAGARAPADASHDGATVWGPGCLGPGMPGTGARAGAGAAGGWLPDAATLSLLPRLPSGDGGRAGTRGAAGSGPPGGRKGTSARSRRGARQAGGCAPQPQRRPSPSGRVPRARQEAPRPGPRRAAAAGPPQPDPGPGPAGAGSSASRPSRSVMAKPRGRGPAGEPPGTGGPLLARPSQSASRPVMAPRSPRTDGVQPPLRSGRSSRLLYTPGPPVGRSHQPGAGVSSLCTPHRPPPSQLQPLSRRSPPSSCPLPTPARSWREDSGGRTRALHARSQGRRRSPQGGGGSPAAPGGTPLTAALKPPSRRRLPTDFGPIPATFPTPPPL